jgi:hypothetical protein
MLTARQLVEPSSSKRKSSKPKTEKPEKASRSKDETPEEKEARREERRIKKHEREAKKAAEMTALLGIPKMKRHRVEKEKDKHRKKEKMVEKEATTSESDSDSDSNSEEDKGKDKEILVVETPVKEPKKERKLKSIMADQFVGGLMARFVVLSILSSRVLCVAYFSWQETHHDGEEDRFCETRGWADTASLALRSYWRQQPKYC